MGAKAQRRKEETLAKFKCATRTNRSLSQSACFVYLVKMLRRKKGQRQGRRPVDMER